MAGIEEAIRYDTAAAEASLRALSERLAKVATEQRSAEEATRAEDAALRQLDTGLRQAKDALDGVSSSQRQLLELQGSAKSLFEKGRLSAEEYETALGTLRQRTQQLGAAESQLDAFGKASGRAAEGISRLGPLLSTLSPELGGLVQLGGGSAQALRSIAEGGEIAGVGLTTMGAALGIVAVVGGGAYLVLDELNARLERMQRQIESSNKALDTMQQGLKGLASAEQSLATREGVVSGKIDPAQVVLEQARAAAAQQYAGLKAGAGQELEAALARQTALQNEDARAQNNQQGAREYITSTLTGRGKDAREADLADAAAAVAQARNNLAELGKAEEDLAFRSAQVTLAEKAQTEAHKNTTAATKDAAKESDQAQKAADAQADALMKQVRAYQEARDPMLGFQRVLAEIDALQKKGALSATEAAQATAMTTEQMTALTAARNKDLQTLRDEAMYEQSKPVLSAEQQARAAAAAARGTDSALQRQLELASSVAGMGSSVLSGDITGALAAGLSTFGGPYGAAAGTALQGVVTLGQEGADQIADKVHEGLSDLTTGLEELPDLIRQLPSIFVDTAPELGKALVLVQYQVVGAVLEGFASLPEQLGESLYDGLKKWWEEAKDSFNPFNNGSGNTVGQRIQNAAVDAVRIGAAIATGGASEVALGIANAATDGGVRRALYAGSREDSRGRTASRGRQEEVAAQAAWHHGLKNAVSVNRDLVSVGLTTTLARDTDSYPHRFSPLSLRSN